MYYVDVFTLSLNFCTENGETVGETVVTIVKDEEVCFKGNFSDSQKWNLTKCVKITENNSCKRISKLIELDTCNYTMMVDMPPGWYLIN